MWEVKRNDTSLLDFLGQLLAKSNKVMSKHLRVIERAKIKDFYFCKDTQESLTVRLGNNIVQSITERLTEWLPLDKIKIF